MWHDLALFSLALDSLLRSCDLLRLKVADLTYADGRMRQNLNLKQRKTKNNVRPELTPNTQRHLQHWIEWSGKSRNDYLFTRKKQSDALPITHKHFVSLVKSWAILLGLPPDDYAAHSLRRSKAIALYRAGAPIAELSEALGHKTEASTLRYLGVTQDRVRKVMLSLDMTKGFASTLAWEENGEKT